MVYALSAHSLGEAVDKAVADLPRSLGRDVAWRKTGAPGGDDKIAGSRMPAQCRDDQIEFVWQYLVGHNLSARTLKKLADRRTRKIDLIAAEAAIADGQNHSAKRLREAGSHPSSVRSTWVIPRMGQPAPFIWR